MSTVSPAESKAEKLNTFFRLVADPEIRDEVQTWFDSMLATSSLNLVKRVAAIETTTGLNDYSDFEDEEEHEPTIPERIDILNGKIENLTISNPVYKEPVNIIPETKTEARAVFLVEYLEKEVKERNGQISLNGNELKDFLTKIIPERYNPDFVVKKDQNVRKIKKDVLEKAKKLFGNMIEIIPNKHGRHETRVLYRPLQTVTT